MNQVVILYTQEYKYPFRLYYLSYALFVSTILILIFRCKTLLNIFNNKIILFISKHSLWIYLWHILCLYFLKPINMNFILKFIIVTVISCIITYIQSIVVNKLNGKINKEILNIFKG